MPKVVLSSKEKAIVNEYVDFLVNNPDPCRWCPPVKKSTCCGCQEAREWYRKVDELKVKNLLSIDCIKNYVTLRVELSYVIQKLEKLQNKKKGLEKEISNILEKIDLDIDESFPCTSDSNKLESFNCTSCRTIYKVRPDYCHDAIGKDNRCRKHYPCPKCGNVNFSRND